MEFEQFDERTTERMLGAATATGGISTYLDFRHSSLTAGRLEAGRHGRQIHRSRLTPLQRVRSSEDVWGSPPAARTPPLRWGAARHRT